MTGTVTALFRDDFYLSTCEARVTAILEGGGIELDQTCFYATSGGQPGDTGFEREDGSRIDIVETRHGANKDVIVHMSADGAPVPAVGEKLVLHIDRPRRYRLMRMHTACHLLSVVCPFPITGAAVGEEESRVDFDMSETIDKDEVTAGLMKLVEENHPVYAVDHRRGAGRQSGHRQVEECPPADGAWPGQSRLHRREFIDRQPALRRNACSETQEVGAIHIAKIEKKGKENRRFRIRFATPEDGVAV